MSFICFTYLLLLSVMPILCEEREDFYSSISGLETLLELEYHLLDNLRDYLDRELAKHQQINLLLENFENEKAKALNNPEKYFGSPINVFKAIKRSVVDFKDLENYILEQSNEEEYDINATKIESELPIATAEDLSGAVMGLARLQKTYKLNTSDLAEGKIWGVQYSSGMSVSDLFYVGKELYDTEKYELSLEWYEAAWERLKEQIADEWGFINEVKVLEEFSAAAYEAEKFQIARDLTNELLRIDPSHVHASKNLKTVEMDIFDLRNKISRRVRAKKIEPPTVLELYEATCRGDLEQSPMEERPLRCMYTDNNIPFLKIAPFKMEQLSLNPLMVYYHDVIYENEIDKVLEVATPQITRSKIGGNEKRVVSTIRTSKHTWLEFDEYDFLPIIKQRLLDMTQLSFETAEDLQVANYGIGGHYGPHYDFFFSMNHSADGEERGNRIATALFYIEDVELGGATAFPYLKLAVKPVKRSLVLWYNLHSSSDPDYRMKHAGCPVLIGSKWILNLWIRERGQEFKRPCELQSDTNLSTGYV